MKFSITKLEQARKNPVEFAKLLKSGNSSANEFGGYPKSMRWLNAVCDYHKNNNLSEAFDSIDRGFSGRKNTAQHRRELQIFYKALDKYKTEIISRKLSLIKSRESIYIEINSTVEISGIIPLVFMKPTIGFSAYFISSSNPTWESELKFPIIQSFVSENVFKTNAADIEVGYIDHFTGEFYEKCFSVSEIKTYRRELKNIGQTIKLNL